MEGKAWRQHVTYRVGDQNDASCRRIAQARGEVHRIAGDAVAAVAGAAAGHDLAAGDADVHVQVTTELAAQIRHGVADRERGAHRPLRIVAVGDRRAEHRHCAVADVLVDSAPESLDQAVDQAEEAVGHLVHRLGPELVGQAGVPGQVAEQHAHLPPLAVGCG